MVLQIKRTKASDGLTYKDQCESMKIPYSTFMRWKTRMNEGREPIAVPGPRKVEPLDIKGLEERVLELRHGRRRTVGTGALYEECREQISRRDLGLIIRGARKDRNAEYAHIIWHKPGMIWGLDDARYRSQIMGELFYLHTVQDICSRYKFKPLVDMSLAKGPTVAANLERLFGEHGAPLFLKRDYGSNLNHRDVEDLLAEMCVIPLNSPPHYPQYNGGIERAQRELKSWLAERDPLNVREAQAHAEMAAHDLNHQYRQSLSGKTSCSIFNNTPKTTYNKRQRKEIYDWIKEMSLCIIASEERLPMHAAWRVAAEIWLRKHGFVTVVSRRKCYPFFQVKMSHN